MRHHRRATVERIEGGEAGVTGLRLRPETGEEAAEEAREEGQLLPVEGVFIYGAGSKPLTDFLEEKVLCKADGGVLVDEDMATNVPGVYAVGDIINKPHKQADNAASDGVHRRHEREAVPQGDAKLKVHSAYQNGL